MAWSLDTAAATERIIAAGADPALARAIVAEVAQSDSGLASKADLEAAITNLERRLILAGAVGLGLLFAALRVFGG